MKVSAAFNENGLTLYLTAETEAEQRMVGAVLNKPDGSEEIDKSLMVAELSFDGHFTNRRVKALKLTVFKDQSERPA